MKKPSKYAREFVLQGNYGYGWDDLVAEDSRREILARLKEYRENQPASYRIKAVRVLRSSASPRRVSKDQMSFMFEAPVAPPSRIRVKPAKKATKKPQSSRTVRSVRLEKLVPYRISGEDVAMLRRIGKAKPSRKGRHKGHRRWEVWSREGGKLTHKAASFQRKDRAELMARESRRLFGGSYSVVDAWRGR